MPVLRFFPTCQQSLKAAAAASHRKSNNGAKFSPLTIVTRRQRQRFHSDDEEEGAKEVEAEDGIRVVVCDRSRSRSHSSCSVPRSCLDQERRGTSATPPVCRSSGRTTSRWTVTERRSARVSAASSLDFLMSDGEEDASFLSLPNPAFSQRSLLTAELSESSAPRQQQLLLQTLQDKVCDLRTRLDVEALQHPVLGRPGGLAASQEALSGGVDKEQLVTRLHSQVEDLEKKLLDQTQEVERLRSELGATDLEKQLELLEVENRRLKRELTSCRSSEAACSCSQDVEALRREVSHQENQARQRERHLAELERQLLDKTAKVDTLQWQLDRSATAPVEPSGHWSSDQKAVDQLQNEEAVQGVAQAGEAEPDESTAALQLKNVLLQEQLCVQRHLLRELETQLHDSQRTCAQLRTQIAVYDGEMERAQKQLDAELVHLKEEKNRMIEEAFIRAESEMKAVHENLAGVRMKLVGLHPALRTLTCDYNTLKKQVHHFPVMLDKAITDAKHEICQVISEVSSTNQNLLDKYKREMNLRKKCHNELVRLKGNIRVLCRVRPVSQQETDSADTRTVLTFDPDDDAILYLTNKGKVTTFDLDKVFRPQATQEEVFQEVQSLVTSCIDGFNVCIFAYGQTGSGKTYTMEGVPEDRGLNQRALCLLFSEVTDKSPDWEYKISVSMVEIYNETLRDLLGENVSDKLDIKMNPDGSGQLYVPGLTQVPVQSPDDINKVLELGVVCRATACTNLNEHSSRSHALLIVSVNGLNATTGSCTQGKLNLVDLAGSERIRKSGAEGGRLREAQCINKSLSALGDVINALRSKHAHVPFRNSRLTYLLQDSLGGDSKTVMMVQVSPLLGNLSESLCSLKFAQRVRSVELNSTSAVCRRLDNSSASSSPTHDGVELDSPPVTPLPLPISRASSAGSSLSSASRASSSSRRKSQSQLSTGRLKMAA
ncbi:kinesin-like protein KIFC3 isoform X4 [Dunckerocampus dactyliophorus]|uniref:kinesin-like protein KIFC3 isoform X4 n=1 Tax=Dunckerocampus dactyliophorus TaxID=161453 RepID=UPI002406B7FB|nr:kinesin-like protein KIFC3 isoform X4 [Dunckerocampus dactyliophorus]